MKDPILAIAILRKALEEIVSDLGASARLTRTIGVQALARVAEMDITPNLRLITDEEARELRVLLDQLFDTGGERETLARTVAEQLGITLSAPPPVFDLENAIESGSVLRLLFRGKQFDAVVTKSEANREGPHGQTVFTLRLVEIQKVQSLIAPTFPGARAGDLFSRLEGELATASPEHAVFFARARYTIATGERHSFRTRIGESVAVVYGIALGAALPGQLFQFEVEFTGGLTVAVVSRILQEDPQTITQEDAR